MPVHQGGYSQHANRGSNIGMCPDQTSAVLDFESRPACFEKGSSHGCAQLGVHEIPKIQRNVAAQIERAALTFVPMSAGGTIPHCLHIVGLAIVAAIVLRRKWWRDQAEPCSLKPAERFDAYTWI
jgi:hypothetical protein